MRFEHKNVVAQIITMITNIYLSNTNGKDEK